jgi:Ca-activated chloride channel family protein
MRTLAALALLAGLAVGKPAASFLLDTRIPGGGWPAEAGGKMDTGATALGVLVLVGAGHKAADETPHGTALREAIAALLKGQDARGKLGDPAEHALAAVALCELAREDGDGAVRNGAQWAVLHLLRLQRPDGSFGDLVTTGWAGLALASARAAKIPVDAAARESLRRWLDATADSSPRFVAIATALRLFGGDKPDEVQAGVDVCLAHLPDPASVDEVYWYFGTLALFQVGGTAWRKWNESFTGAILAGRDPDGGWEPSPVAVHGRVGATALRIMSLGIYYRYDRVFGGDAGAGKRGRGGRANLRAGGGSGLSAESYDRIASEGFKNVWDEDTSTFSVDVDTAAYANVRRFLVQEGRLPPKDAVRIEEMINSFRYGYAAPDARSPHPFHVNVEVTSCPWQPLHRLVRIGLQATHIEARDRPASNLVFLVDVSGSMRPDNKLPLLKRALHLLVEQLDARDSVSIVVYAGAAGLVLPPTRGGEGGAILAALERLEAGGSTNGGEGIELAYATARANLVHGGINRVILCTDGDFNVGVTDRGALTRRIEEEAKAGVALTVLGFGMGNLKDATLEELSNKGDGNYAYIDTINEARKVLVEQLTGTLLTVAKDAKVQVFFNPLAVASWRLIGYENRRLAKADFNDDRKDAGDIGAGHSVTALYEVALAGGGGEARKADENPFLERMRASAEAGGGALLRLRLRYKPPGAAESVLLEQDVRDGGGGFDGAGGDLRWAASVAMFGMLLRGDEWKAGSTYELCEEIARSALGDDPVGHRREMLDLIAKAKALAAAAKEG